MSWTLANLERAADALLAARRVDIYGSGGGAIAALELQYKLMRVGVRAVPHTDAEMQIISATLLTSADLAVGISHSGESHDVLHALKTARQAGARTIAITNHPLLTHCHGGRDQPVHGGPGSAGSRLSTGRARGSGGLDRRVVYLHGRQAPARSGAQPGAHRRGALPAPRVVLAATISVALRSPSMIDACMKQQVVSVSPSTTVREAAHIVVERHVGTLPVVDQNGILVGVVGIEDLLKVFMPDFVALLDNIDFVHDFGAMETPGQQDLLKAARLTYARSDATACRR